MCESTAGRHIAAARVCRKHPEAVELVARGELHASALSLLKKYLTPENAADLFELCTHRSTRKVEELLAGVHFTADGEFRELLERVRGLAGHRLPNGDLMTLLNTGSKRTSAS